MQHPRLSSIIDQLGSKPVRSVTIVLGELHPFNEEQLHAQWNLSRFANTPLHVRVILAEQQCMVCFGKYHPAQKETSCPICGSVGAKILAGEEFYLESVEEENE